jgi:AcrR family transcriptional regulator
MIIDAAAELFSERGFEATTVADIAATAGLSPSAGGIYRHFDSKEALLDAVVDLALERVGATERLRAAVASLDLDTHVEIELAGRYLLDRVRESRELLRIMERDLVHFPRLAERVRVELIVPVMVAFEQWLLGLEIPARDATADAAALAEVMWGSLARRALFDVSELSDDRFIAAWSTALEGALTGVTARA